MKKAQNKLNYTTFWILIAFVGLGSILFILLKIYT